MTRLELPYPPSANVLWRNVRGRVVKSREARAYVERVRWCALQQGFMGPPLSMPCAVSVTVYRPRRVGDLDNALKATLDSLKGLVFEDDSQVVELHASRMDDPASPRVVVLVDPRPVRPPLKTVDRRLLEVHGAPRGINLERILPPYQPPKGRR